MINKALIIAPLRVCYSVWSKEVEKWNDFKDLKVQILHGANKEKNLEKDADIYLINPEGLPWLLSKSFRRIGFDVLVVDESSKFKATNTKRFKLLRTVLQYFNRRYILTGSPAPNGLLDLFGQIYILDLGAALGRFITHYRNTYFYPTGFGGYEWRLQPGADVKIKERIKPLTLRLDAEDYLELPKLIVNNIEVDLPPDAWQMYREMEQELLTELESGEIVAVNNAVASGKCSQIANGGVYDEYGKAYFIHDQKAQAVADLVSELQGTPALVAYEYGHDLDRLRDALGKNTPFVGGGVSPKRSTELEDLWNSGQLPVLLGQPQSIAHGLNLQQSGNHVVWHSITWNFEHYDQFIRRIRRQGSTHDKVFVHHIVARNTIDELKLMALNGKFRTQKDLLDGLRVLIKSRKSGNFKGFTSPEKKSSVVEYESFNQPTEDNMTTEAATTEEKPNKFAKKTSRETAAEKGKEDEFVPGFAKKAKKEKAAKAKPKASKGKAPTKAKASVKKPVKASERIRAARTSAFSGKKIKVLSKEHGARDGSTRAALMEAIISSKTTDEALAKYVKNGKGEQQKVSSADIKYAIDNKLISAA